MDEWVAKCVVALASHSLRWEWIISGHGRPQSAQLQKQVPDFCWRGGGVNAGHLPLTCSVVAENESAMSPGRGSDLIGLSLCLSSLVDLNLTFTVKLLKACSPWSGAKTAASF